MRFKVVFSMVVLVAVVVFVAVASAGKIGNGSTVGTAQVFVPNPVQSLGDESLTDQKDSDAAVPACGLPHRRADAPRRQRLPARRLRERLQLDREPRVLADEHVRVHAAPGRVRAGDGVLLDDRGADVHPPARLRLVTAADQQRATGRSDQPVGSRQLVRDRPSEGRAALRQGRRRRRGGRRGDPARVRPRHPPVAGLQLRPGGERRDQRGLRRLLGGYRLGRRFAPGTPETTASVRGGLGRDLVHQRAGALPAAGRRAISTTRPT